MNTSLKLNRRFSSTIIYLMNKHLPRIPLLTEPGLQNFHLPTIGQSFTTCPRDIATSSSLCLLSSLVPATAKLSPYFLSTCNFSVFAIDMSPQGKNEEGYVEGKASNDKLSGGLDDILQHILNIYGSRATPTDFEIYAPDATFEDPLMRAQGVKQIKSAFYSLSKIFSESRIVEYTVKEEEISPGNKQVLIDNKQYYKFLGRDINMISLIKLYLQDGKIIRHEDWWDKKPLWNRDTVKTPLVGRITEMSKRASMFATHAFMGFGKDPTK